MKEHLVKWRNSLIHFFYVKLIRPIFFLFEAEETHDRMIKFGSFIHSHKFLKNLISLLFNYQNKVLRQKIAGIDFPNPVGLAAGFDKNAEMFSVFSQMGFGFAEIGSVTGYPCLGNAKPRLWRLPKSRSLVVNYGLKNDGCEKISSRLKSAVCNAPLGISIAKTNNSSSVTDEEIIADYLKSYENLKNCGDYWTINISCPNLSEKKIFSRLDLFDKLLSKIKLVSDGKPIFVKLSPDLDKKQIDEIIEISRRQRIAGFICSNLTRNRDHDKIVDSNVPEEGGLSGKVLEQMSNEMISYIYRKTKGEFVIIGCGGIFSAQDAYKKVKLGASLVQVFTGMIFEGPQLISEINRGLVELLKKDGYKNISEAIGADSN